MKKKIVYNLPIVDKTIVLDSIIPPELAEQKTKEKYLLQESYQRGWNDALEKAKKEAIKDIEVTSQSVHKTICDLKQERNDIWTQCEKEIVKLTLAIAKKIVLHEISKNGNKIIEKIVEEALNKVKDRKILKIHMNPKDIENLRQQEITEFLNDNDNYEIISDSHISSGGCKIITDYGSVDARLETRWKEIETAFEEHTVETEPENENNERESEPTSEVSSET